MRELRAADRAGAVMNRELEARLVGIRRAEMQKKREEDRDKRRKRIERRHYLRSPTLCTGEDVVQEEEEFGEGLTTRDAP